MTYTPRPGSAPEKLIQYLQSLEPGHQINSASASAIMCVSLKHLHATIAPALANGALVKTVSEGGRIWLSLPDALATGAELGRVEQPDADTAPDTAPEPEPFHAMLHIDGDLDLHGMQPLQDGGYRIHAEDVGRLMRLLGGC